MIKVERDPEPRHVAGVGHLSPTGASEPVPSHGDTARKKMGLGQRITVVFLLILVLAPPLAGFYSYFSGVPLHFPASAKEPKDDDQKPGNSPGSSSVKLVPGRPHTVEVGDEVATALGIKKGGRDAVAIAKPPSVMRPLVLPGSTMIIPGRLTRIKPRFAPARIIEIGKVWDRNPKTGMTDYRELRSGDKVTKGELLCVLYSVDVANTKNDLLDALVQFETNQELLDNYQQNRGAIPKVTIMTQEQQVRKDRNAINKNIFILKGWDIPQEDIDALQDEAKKIHSKKDEWMRTPEGRWVNREKQAKAGAENAMSEAELAKGRVTIRAPFNGVILEENVTVGEMVTDPTVNLLQIADVSKLLVAAHCPEDDLPALEALHGVDLRWTVNTIFAPPEGLSGPIADIGYLIDPNQHTAIIKGYIDNPGDRIRGTQFARATIEVPPPRDVVEIPADALVEDGKQSLIFVQPDAAKHQFTMRRVQVAHRFERTVFVQSTPIPKDQQLTPDEAEEGMLPKEPLLPGERVLLAGPMELKRVVIDLDSQSTEKPANVIAKVRAQSASELESQPKPKAGKS
jgi:cobalt-zinc-cadmium efflux system membrane fusion protein